jgi:hypothetical protein
MKKTVYFLLLISCSISAQIKGIVKDSISNKPIPYVSIWVENENTGTTSEENGEFIIYSKDKNKKLIFSALGFEKKIIKTSEATEVKLKPTEYQLDEIVIVNRRETKQIEIGILKNVIYQAFDNAPRIDIKFFPYFPSYKKTKFIKKVSLYTDSNIENASMKIHFYSVDSLGFPSDELINKDFIVTVKKGMKKSTFDVSDFNLKIPKNGLFVGFEKLIIEKNKIEKVITDYNTNTTQIQKTYYPFVLYNNVEREFLFTFSGGKWRRQTKDNSTSSEKFMIYEPAINLILTN